MIRVRISAATEEEVKEVAPLVADALYEKLKVTEVNVSTVYPPRKSDKWQKTNEYRVFISIER